MKRSVLYISSATGMFMVVICFVFCCQMSRKIPLTENLNWLTKLPPCPCKNPDKNRINLSDRWARDIGDINKYHKGASECFRSYPAIQTEEGLSGQQCCYDSEGNLITEGSGAGTPDKVSTCDGEDMKGNMTTRYAGIIEHFKKDVKPWESFGGRDSGWVKYNIIWKPNNANGCPLNKINK